VPVIEPKSKPSSITESKVSRRLEARDGETRAEPISLHASIGPVALVRPGQVTNRTLPRVKARSTEQGGWPDHVALVPCERTLTGLASRGSWWRCRGVPLRRCRMSPTPSLGPMLQTSGSTATSSTPPTAAARRSGQLSPPLPQQPATFAVARFRRPLSLLACSRPLYNRDESSGLGGNWVDGTPGQRTVANATDGFCHLAKVGVAGSNPVFRSKGAGQGGFSSFERRSPFWTLTTSLNFVTADSQKPVPAEDAEAAPMRCRLSAGLRVARCATGEQRREIRSARQR
jgi:hypothetical protein